VTQTAMGKRYRKKGAFCYRENMSALEMLVCTHVRTLQKERTYA
jgi:hypothetical protein